MDSVVDSTQQFKNANMTVWQDRTASKCRRLNNSIPIEWRVEYPPFQGGSVMPVAHDCGILTADELLITESSATDLVDHMAAGHLTAVAVTTAFCKRAAIAHQMALTRAQELDDYFKTHGKPIGPLHGLPISLKDQVRVKGVETTIGYVSWLGRYETEDSILTEILQKTGAVFYAKTSVSQTLMGCETVNNIIGRTLNPWNRDWSCGGSSGGEGALIGFRGSVLGVGTDIGGSVRIPAAFNFLYGIRPSHGRLPYRGIANSMNGKESINSVIGAITHSAKDLRLFMTSVLAGEPWRYDSKVIPLPWRPSEEEAITIKIQSGGLNLGFYTFDGVVRPHPPVIRGVNLAVDKLRENGHNVIPWEPRKHDIGVDLFRRILTADGCADVMENINASKEPIIFNVKGLLQSSNKELSMNEFSPIQGEIWDYQCEYVNQWREVEEQLGKSLDAIIAPVTATAAVRHDQFRYDGYSSIINLLDLTSVTVPVTFADKNIDLARAKYRAVNGIDEGVNTEYDPNVYHAAPVSVQVIGQRLSEEKTLAIAAELGRLMGNPG